MNAKHIFLMIASLPMLGACVSDTESTNDGDALSSTNSALFVGSYTGKATDPLKISALKLNKDGSYTLTSASKDSSGTWKLEGNTAALKLSLTAGGVKTSYTLTPSGGYDFANGFDFNGYSGVVLAGAAGKQSLTAVKPTSASGNCGGKTKLRCSLAAYCKVSNDYANIVDNNGYCTVNP